jgi:hypothetical protein
VANKSRGDRATVAPFRRGLAAARAAMRQHPRWTVATAAAVSLVLLAYVVATFIDEPLRRRIERDLNAQLVGYQVRIERLDFHPLGFSWDLENSTIVQIARPDPPVASLPELSASVQWRALLSGRLVADFIFKRPKLHITLAQARQEARDRVPIEKRGWQDALQEVYPLKINEFRVVDGDITYVDRGPFKPLHVTDVNFRAGNIRNIRSRDREYPSDVHLEATLVETATLRADGHADFLATPHAGFRTDIELEGLRLDYLAPVIHHYNLAADGGTLSAAGKIEYAPRTKIVELRHATVRNAAIDYVHRGEEEAPGERAAKKVVKVATKPEAEPAMVVRADQLRIADSRIAFANRHTNPPYRVFVSDLDVTVDDFSNQRNEGGGEARVRGKFMGSGAAALDARFQPATERSDFDMKVQIENVDLQGMNDLLQAHGNFDVSSGKFSVYSELAVRGGRVDGYVKPLFSDLDVYDPERDKDKALGQKLYEGLVGGVATALENRSRDEVATKTDISGPIEDPQTSTWQIILRLVQNAFFKSILPGLEAERRARG